MKTWKRITIGLTVLAFCAFIAWVAGWDFNTRGIVEAYGVVVTLTFAFLAVMACDL